MDKIIQITVSIFLIVLVGFVAMISYNGYVETAYRESLTGTYSYTCTITTDSPLTNVTLFIPVPSDRAGNSPMVSRFSAETMPGVPRDWNTALFDTGKATLLKVSVASITLPQGSGPAQPLTISMTSDTADKVAVNTLDPVANGVMFRPVQDLVQTSCTDVSSGSSKAACYTYTTAVYADYRAAPDANVTFTSTVRGRNSWQVFGPGSNDYKAEIHLVLTGEHHGWATAAGTLAVGRGDYPLSGS